MPPSHINKLTLLNTPAYMLKLQTWVPTNKRLAPLVDCSAAGSGFVKMWGDKSFTSQKFCDVGSMWQKFWQTYYHSWPHYWLLYRCGDRHHWESSRLLVRGWRGKHADILSRCLLLQACCLGFGCFAVMTCHSFSFFSPTKTETSFDNLLMGGNSLCFQITNHLFTHFTLVVTPLFFFFFFF